MIKYIIYIIVFIISIIFGKDFLHKIECMLLFQPIKLDPSFDFEIDRHSTKLKNSISKDVSIKEINIPLNNKDTINAIYFKNPNVSKHVIYCHGNAGNIQASIAVIHKMGQHASVIIFDYRGYGKSTGHPTEENVYEDIHTVWKHLVDKEKVLPKDIALYGTSLGCAPVSWLANKLCKNKSHNSYPKLIVLESGFSNLKNIASDLYPPFIVSLMSLSFDNLKYLKEIGNKIPVLLAHSPRDEIIHIKHMYELKNTHKDKIKSVEVNGNHNTPKLEHNHHYLELFKKLIN